MSSELTKIVVSELQGQEFQEKNKLMMYSFFGLSLNVTLCNFCHILFIETIMEVIYYLIFA